MQALLDSTHALSASFSERVATATSEFDDKHAASIADLLARDAQLEDYVNTAKQSNHANFDLFAAQLASVGDTKQAELGHKVDEMVTTLRGQLGRKRACRNPCLELAYTRRL